MKRFAGMIAVLFSLTFSASAQSFGTLTIVPTHPGNDLQLNWTSAPSGTNTVNRWVQGGTPVAIGTTSGTSYLDRTVSANVIYYYSVTNGTASTNTAFGVVSDITQSFPCPTIPQVVPNLLGVDRTVSFTSANGTPVSFTISVPVGPFTTVKVAPCNGASGCSDYTNINKAIASNRIVQLGVGDYHLNNPNWVRGGSNYNIQLYSPSRLHDIIIAGAGLDSNNLPTTHLYFNQGTAVGNVLGLTLNNTNRVLFRNFSIDWDFPTAIPGTISNVTAATIKASISGSMLTVTDVASGTLAVGDFLFDTTGSLPTLVSINAFGTGTGGTGTYSIRTSTISQALDIASETMTAVWSQRFNVSDPTYYIPDPTNPPTAVHVDGYNLKNRTYNLHAGGRAGENGTFNTNFSVDHEYYYTINGQAVVLPDGTDAIMFVRTAGAIYLAGATHTSFENVQVWGGGGQGIVAQTQSRGLRLTNFAITRKPDSELAPGERPHYVSLIGDSDSQFNMGDILIENSEFGFVEDDTFHYYGNSVQLQTLSRDTGFTVTGPNKFVFHNPGNSDFLQFVDPTTLAPISMIRPLAKWTQTKSGGTWTWTVTFSPAVPELIPYFKASAANMPLVFEPLWSSQNVGIVNSCAHDNHGRLFPKSINGLIKNNVLANSYYGPIELSQDQVAEPTGPSPGNYIITGNKIIGSGYGQTDYATGWSPLQVSNGFFQTGWAQAGGINVYSVGGMGFTPTGYPINSLIISDNFISNTPGLAIAVLGVSAANVTGNTIVDANSVAFASGFNATYCGSNSHGQQAHGANQPWCFAKVAAQGAIMVAWSNNIFMQNNTYLGTSASAYVDPTAVWSGIAGHPVLH